MTGADGTFRFDNLDPKEYTLYFSKSGYDSYNEKVTVSPGASSNVEVKLVGKSSIVGTVKDSNTQNALSGVTVALMPGNLSVVTNVYGTFRFDDLDSQDYTLYFSKTGYDSKNETVTVSDGETRNIEVLLSEINNNGGGGETNGIVVSGGLIFYYTFDDDDCTDMSGNDNDGIPVNNPSYLTDTPTGSGKSLSLNGQNKQYVNIIGNPFDGLTSYSVSFWIKDFSEGAVICGVSAGYFDSDHKPKICILSDGDISFDSYGSYYDTHRSSGAPMHTACFSYDYSPIQSNGWHHIVVSYSNEKASLYVDGSIKDVLEKEYRNLSEIIKVNIGGDGNGTFPVCASMKLDNFRLYGKGLTKDEVKQIYNSEK